VVRRWPLCLRLLGSPCSGFNLRGARGARRLFRVNTERVWGSASRRGVRAGVSPGVRVPAAPGSGEEGEPRSASPVGFLVEEAVHLPKLPLLLIVLRSKRSVSNPRQLPIRAGSKQRSSCF